MKKSTADNQHLKFAVLAADTCLFTLQDNQLYVRLIAVDRPPYFVNIAGLPGGLLTPQETAEQAALRHVSTKGHIAISKIYTEQLYTFSEVQRDPRGRVVAVTYLALVPWEQLSQQEQENTADTWWAPVQALPRLAYDHKEVIAVALRRLASRARYTSLISKLLPNEFTLTELEKAYESVVGIQLDKRNFRKKILKLRIIKKLPKQRSGLKHRPAFVYSFSSKKIQEIEIL